MKVASGELARSTASPATSQTWSRATDRATSPGAGVDAADAPVASEPTTRQPLHHDTLTARVDRGHDTLAGARERERDRTRALSRGAP